MIPTDIINLIKSFLIKCPTCEYLNVKNNMTYCGKCKETKNNCKLQCYNCLKSTYLSCPNWTYCCSECYDILMDDDDDSIGYDIINYLTF
jgi:hypothetical protein